MPPKPMYLIYKITNIKNGKIYIGAHKTLYKHDDYFGSGKKIKAAIRRSGIKNFKKEILHICKSEEEMYALEKKIVNKTFVLRKDTYNMRIGGTGGFRNT